MPILDNGALVGVIEAVNKMDGTPFDDDDQFVLTSMAESASTALHNASLLMAERKVEILETLVTVSHEITSTLNLERMLQTIVNAPQAVIPYERAAIALETARQIQAERGDRPDASECRCSGYRPAERRSAVGGAGGRSDSRAAGRR